jgi:hypothetical protein
MAHRLHGSLPASPPPAQAMPNPLSKAEAVLRPVFPDMENDGRLTPTTQPDLPKNEAEPTGCY